MSNNGMMALFGIDLPKIEIPILSDIFNMLASLGNVLFSLISQAIGTLLYGIQMGFFLLIDCVNAIFRSIAGLDVYYVNGVQTEGDIVYSLLQNPVVTSVFTSVLIASIFLLFVTTFIAIFKTEFDMSKSNAKGPIIGRAIKSIIYFACVPIICILGVYISNVFLRTFDAATSQGAASMSSQIFAAAAYDSNRARNDSGFANRVKNSGILATINANSTQAEVAQAIDDAFRSNEKAKGIDSNDNSSTKPIKIDSSWQGHMQAYAWSKAGPFGSVTLNVNSFSITNTILVYYFYDLLGYNYLVGYLASFMVSMLLLTLIIGVIQRIFELTILFVVSPAFVATMPLDEGARFGKWKDAFVKRTLSAYGPVVGINLLFMVLTFVQDIDIFDPNMFAVGGLFNSIVQCLFIVVGLLAVKDFSAMISELVGSNDALSQGESKKEAVKSLGGKVATAGATGLRMGAKTAAWAGRSAATRVSNYREQKAVEKHNAALPAAEQKVLDDIKKGFKFTGPDADKEAMNVLNGWKNGTLTGTAKTAMKYLEHRDPENYGIAKEGKKTFTAKKAPKLDLMDEFDKLDDTITGSIREKAKASDKKHENPYYALMGKELKKTKYSSHHKERADNEDVKKHREEEEKKLAASTIINAKKMKGELDISVTNLDKIEAELQLKYDENMGNGHIKIANDIKTQIDDIQRQKDANKDMQKKVDEILSGITKLKNIDPEHLNIENAKIASVASDVHTLSSGYNTLSEKLEKYLKGLK